MLYADNLLCTPQQRDSAEAVMKALGDRAAGIFDGAVMHVPIETAEAARQVAADLGADCCVAIGGGSTIGLGKAIAMTSSLPIIAIPTTFCLIGVLLGLLAVIFGHIGQSQYKQATGRNNGMAIAGLICGYLSFALLLLLVIS